MRRRSWAGVLRQGPGEPRAEAFATLRPADLGDQGPSSCGRGRWTSSREKRVYSAPVRVRVMDEAEHLKYVSRRFDAWIEEAAEVQIGSSSSSPPTRRCWP